MFERDDGRALGDSFVERAHLKSHLVLRYVLIFSCWIIGFIWVNHQVFMVSLQLEVVDLLDVTELAVK